MQALLKLTNFVSKTFALWAIVFALLAFLFPEQFKTFAPYIPYLLGLVTVSYTHLTLPTT